MNELAAAWAGFSPEVKAAVIGAAATFLTGGVGFSAVILQIGAQGRANRRNVADTERRRIKSEMYEDTVRISSAVQDSAITFSNAMRLLGQGIVHAAAARAAGKPVQLEIARMPAILAAHSAMSNAAVEFVFLIERRRIIDPRLLVFRTAMSVALFDIGELYHKQFVPVAVPLLPADLPDGNVVFNPPDVGPAEAFNQLTTSIANACGAITTCVEDFQVEMQNLLLGDLFNNKVKHRVTIDPAARVVRLDEATVLERHFSTNTAWGTHIQQYEEKARLAFPAPENPPFWDRFRERVSALIKKTKT